MRHVVRERKKGKTGSVKKSATAVAFVIVGKYCTGYGCAAQGLCIKGITRPLWRDVDARESTV
jgi:hypothetical protein